MSTRTLLPAVLITVLVAAGVYTLTNPRRPAATETTRASDVAAVTEVLERGRETIRRNRELAFVFVEERTCVRVVDGDTIELDGGEKVRYIGIDTPETVHPRKPVEWMGKEATEANRVLVEGRRVLLEYDSREKDTYGSTLAYVYAGDVMVNERLVEMGYVQVFGHWPNVKYLERFLEAQRDRSVESIAPHFL